MDTKRAWPEMFASFNLGWDFLSALKNDGGKSAIFFGLIKALLDCDYWVELFILFIFKPKCSA